MKRILSKRILSATLVLALALALCTTASAEVYTHPEAGFGFTVPEGWIAIDGQNAAAILEVGKELVDLPPEALAALDQAEGMAMVFLYEKAGAHPLFRNSINIVAVDAGMEIPIALLPMIGGELAAELAATLPGFVVTTAMEAATFGKRDAATMAGEYTMHGLPLSIWQVYLVSGTTMYTITLTSLTDELADYASILDGLVTSFIAPYTRLR